MKCDNCGNRVTKPQLEWEEKYASNEAEMCYCQEYSYVCEIAKLKRENKKLKAMLKEKK